MIHGTIKTADERAAENAAAKAVQSGQVNPWDIEAEEDYIPPSWRGKRAGHVPVSE